MLEAVPLGCDVTWHLQSLCSSRVCAGNLLRSIANMDSSEIWKDQEIGGQCLVKLFNFQMIAVILLLYSATNVSL